MKYLVTLVPVMALAACANIQNGSTAVAPVERTVKCEYVAGVWDQCQAQANEICKGAGFEMLRQTSEPWTVSPNKPSNSMTFVCKK